MKQLFNRLPPQFLSVISVAVLMMILSYTSIGNSLESSFYRLAVKLSPSQQLTAETVVVGLDEAVFEEYGEWPWASKQLARLLASIRKAKPKSIGLMMPLEDGQTSSNLNELVGEIKKGEEAIANKKEEVLDRSKSKSRTNRLTDLNQKAEMLAFTRSWLSKADVDARLLNEFWRADNVVLMATAQETDFPFEPGDELSKARVAQVWEGTPWYLNKWMYFLFAPGSADSVMFIQVPGERFLRSAKSLGLSDSEYTMPDPLGVKAVYPLDADSVLVNQVAMLYAMSHGKVLSEQIQYQRAHALKIGDQTKLAVTPGGYFLPRVNSRFVHPTLKQEDGLVPQISAGDILSKKASIGVLRDKNVLIGRVDEASKRDYLMGSIPTVIWSAYNLESMIQGMSINMPSSFYFLQRLMIVLMAVFLLLLSVTWLHRISGLLLSAGIGLLLLLISAIVIISQQLWLPMMSAVVALWFAHAVAFITHRFNTAVTEGKHEAYDAFTSLGLHLQAQGQLDQAFAEYKKCPPTPKVLASLYELAQDFERRRQYGRARKVYEHILNNDLAYQDVAQRMQRLKAMDMPSPAQSIDPHAVDSDTLLLDESQVAKPMIGRYQVEEVLGRGAMGIVYLGSDPKIGRKVAIKTLPLKQEFEGHDLDEAKYRFYREAEASGRLHHPNIVTVYDVGEELDLAYIAMDYAKGKSLENFVNIGEQLPVDEVLTIMIQLAEALNYAHKEGVVHRDIKPANIIYDQESKLAKVTDFGIARLTDSGRTSTGTVLGTPAYMSPEQITGKESDGRSDLFSSGVTMYHLLTGSLPFRGDSMANLIYQITNEKPQDISKYRPILTAKIAAIVNRLLNKDPIQRIQDGGQLARYLTEALADWQSEERYN